MKTSRHLHTAILSHCAIILDRNLVEQISDRVNVLRLEMTGAVNKHDPKAFKHYKAKLATLEQLVAAHVAAQDAITDAPTTAPITDAELASLTADELAAQIAALTLTTDDIA